MAFTDLGKIQAEKILCNRHLRCLFYPSGLISAGFNLADRLISQFSSGCGSQSPSLELYHGSEAVPNSIKIYFSKQRAHIGMYLVILPHL